MDLSSIMAVLSVLAVAGIGAAVVKKPLFKSLKGFLLIGILAVVVSYVFDMVGISAMLGATGIVVLYLGLKLVKIGPFRHYG